MSNTLIACLMIADCIVGVVCIFEKNYPKSLYWFAAALLQVSIIWGFK